MTRPQTEPCDWIPNRGPQERFLRSTVFEVGYGGSAGGGKTESLLIDAIKPIVHGKELGTAWTALLLRRSFPELQGKIIPRSQELYPKLGGRYNETQKTWRFPSGERVIFGHMQYEKDKYNYQGGEYQWVGFDEAQLFSATQYNYLFSRTRSSQGVRCHIRFSCNPNGTSSWIFKRFEPWVNPNHPNPARPGEVRYYKPVGAEDEAGEMETTRDDPMGIPRTFIPSRLIDNPYLLKTDYARNLNILTPIERKRLAEGDWLAMPGSKDYFDRLWCEFIDSYEPFTSVRGWDLAGTTNATSDYTNTTLLGKAVNRVAVMSNRAIKVKAAEITSLIRATHEADKLAGLKPFVALCQDPGQAGVFQRDEFLKQLRGIPVSFNKETGSKQTRFQPFSTIAYNGHVQIVRGAWNTGYCEQLEQFPEGEGDAHDDAVDSTSTAYARLVELTGEIDLFERNHAQVKSVLSQKSKYSKVF